MTSLKLIRSLKSGVGPLPVMRFLPAPEQQMIGPFIFLDRAGPKDVDANSPGGVPEHPHAGLSTFTYLLSGAVHHRDSAGHSEIIRSGDMALMTAGTGITHSEMNEPDPSAHKITVSLIQLWLALPDALEDSEPAFELVRANELPEVCLEGAQAKIGIGSAWGAAAPTTEHIDTIFAHLKIHPGNQIKVPAQWEERAILLIDGAAHIGNEMLMGDVLALLPEGEETVVSSNKGANLILLGGNKFPSQRYIAESFVASSMDKLHGYMAAYHGGKFPHIG